MILPNDQLHYLQRASKDITFAARNKKDIIMLQQYSSKVDRFGHAYALLEATEKDQKVTIEYYLVYDDGKAPFIKGGILEVEAVLDQTLETYVKEHVDESLPYMILRHLVDNHEPAELENLADVIFTEDTDAAATIKSQHPEYASMIVQKSNSTAIKEIFA